MTLDNIRKFRVDNELWERAGARAASEGTTLSALIRQWLADYIDNADTTQTMSTAKVAEFLGVSRQRVHQMRRRKQSP